LSFKDKNFTYRLGAMGDQSEGAFERWCEAHDKKYIRWGLDRPPLNLRMIPTRIRCQGFGADQTFKLKLEKHGALHWWNDLHPVDLWVLDSHNDRACFLSLREFDALLAVNYAELHAFPEGKTYFAVNGDALFDAAGERVYATEA
jgi:hypothetical protein